MTETAGVTGGAPRDDLILPFQVAESAVRGRVVRLGPAIDRILSAHKFPQSVSELVGEASALVAMMGASLKFDGKLIFQAQGDGPVRMLVADYTTGGALRATASADEAAANVRGLGALIGKGHMAMTIDQGPDMDRYQGVTSLSGANLAAAAVAYFEQSEQIPTAVKLAVGRVAQPGKAGAWRAGGIIVQFVPGEGGARERGVAALKGPEERELWERAAAFLETTQADELLDPSLSAETLLYRLYHEDGVRVFKPSPVRAECGCNAEKIAAVLGRYSREELADMVDDGFIRVSCEFCRTEYLFDETGTLAKAS
jgi:molecular chaperone Hsp33